ncbi:MAG: hypothetical protein AB1351_02905 [Thermoproteota archaeon]
MVVSPDISEERPLTEGFHIRSEDMLKQQWYIFETLWNHSIPAEVRIRELKGLRDDRGKQQQPAQDNRCKKVIDKFYICAYCREVFILSEDAEEHKHVQVTRK